MKKKPGVMKSAVGCMDRLSKYLERIITAKGQGKLMHGSVWRSMRL